MAHFQPASLRRTRTDVRFAHTKVVRAMSEASAIRAPQEVLAALERAALALVDVEILVTEMIDNGLPLTHVLDPSRRPS